MTAHTPLSDAALAEMERLSSRGGGLTAGSCALLFDEVRRLRADLAEANRQRIRILPGSDLSFEEWHAAWLMTDPGDPTFKGEAHAGWHAATSLVLAKLREWATLDDRPEYVQCLLGSVDRIERGG